MQKSNKEKSLKGEKKNGAASFVCGHPRPSILKEKDYWALNNKGFYVQGV